MVKIGYSVLIRGAFYFSAAAVCWAQSAPFATIQGTVASTSGTPLARATVLLMPFAGSSKFITTVLASSTGTFTISSIPAGTYTVCARPATTGFVDSCLWGIPRVVVNLPLPSGNRPIVINLKPTSLLKARLNDSGVFLAAFPTEKFPPQVTFGVWGRNRFIPARAVKKDATGIDYELAVPSDTPLRANLYSRHVKLTVGANTPVNPRGYSTLLFFDSHKPAPPPLALAAVGRLP
jgi:hypothetical protein